MTEAQNIRAVIDGKTPEKALGLIDSYLEKADAEGERAVLLVARGKQLWRMGRRGEAISAYAEADRLAPGGEAAMLLEHSRTIMDFFNPDLLNP